MAETVKKINLLQGINVDTVSHDIKPWDGPSPHVKNTGIERDGGLTNLYKASENNTLFDEVYYCKSGGKVGLKYDAANDFYRVYSNGKEVSQVPPWGVKTKGAVRAQAEDVVATTDGKLLTVRTLNGKAVIEEFDPAVSWSPIRTKEITMDATILQTFFVRRVDQTFETTDAVVGIFAFSSTSNRSKLFDGSGLLYTWAASGVFSQIFAWWADYGYILSSVNKTAYNTVLLKSDGTINATKSTIGACVARIAWGTGVVTFRGFVGVDPGGAGLFPNVGYEFTPPAAPGGAWSEVAIAATGTVYVSSQACMGAVIRAHNDGGGNKLVEWYDGVALQTWTAGHNTTPEFFGLIDGYSDDAVYIKMHTILNVGAYLSASWDEFSIGKPITEIGEINPDYSPQIMKNDDGDYVVVFKRSDETFGYSILSKSINTRIQAVSDSVSEVNTIYAGNIVDTGINAAAFGGNAFNGFAVPIGGTPTGGASTLAYAARHKNKYGNSVDTGEKSLINSGVAVSSEVLVENLMYGGVKDVIDIYVESDYLESVGANNASYVRPNLVDTLYVEDNRIPAPLGSEVSDLLFTLVDKIAVREPDYDGYQLANEISGMFEAFELYGSIYLFDGVKIKQLALAAGVVSSVDFVANAIGLRYLASAPTLAYFLSDFDNSLYSFDGSRAVQKMGRFNRKAAIQAAAYNVKENTLVLVTADSLIWVRDGIVTENDLPFPTGDFSIFVTENGTFFIQGGGAIQYLYQQIDVIEEMIDGGLFLDIVFARTYDGGAFTDTEFANIIDGGTFDQEGAICPFEWESAFLGFADNMIQVVPRFVIRFKCLVAEETEVTLTYRAFDQERNWTETRVFTIGDTANPWDSDGYAYISFRPASGRCLAASIGVAYTAKLVTFETYAYVDTLERAINKNQR